MTIHTGSAPSTGAGNTVLIGDFMLEVARGNVPGLSHINKFGHNNSLSNVNFEDVWDGSNIYTWATAAQKVNVVSSSANDTSAGTGARTIELSDGLDGSYNLIAPETITMNGTTNVLSANDYFRLPRKKVLTAGSGGENDGDITATQQTSGTLMAQISAGENQTLMAIYTVPAGITAYMPFYWLTLQRGATTEFKLRVRKQGGVFNVNRKVIVDTSIVFNFSPYLVIGEKCDIRIEAKANTGAHETSAGFDLILVDN